MDRTQIIKRPFELKCRVTNPVEFLITLNSKMRGKRAGGRGQGEERVDKRSKGWIVGRKKKELSSDTYKMESACRRRSGRGK
jgi:hypothetical protein